MQPTIVKTSKPSDFLALVPELVGFQPENSVALVAFRGNRTCGALRFNLPEPGAPEPVRKRIATTMIGMLCKIPGVDAVVPVVYTDDCFAESAGIPHRAFISTLQKRCGLSGFLVRDAFCVGADGWGSFLDPECPVGGHPLDEIATRPAGTGESGSERPALGSLASWADLPTVDLATKERLARLLRRYQRLASDPGTVPELIDLVDYVLDPVSIAETALTWVPASLEPAEAALLLFLVQGPATRDQMMLQFAFGEEAGIEAFEVNAYYAALQRDSGGLSMDEVVRQEMERQPTHPQWSSNLMMGWTTTRPDPARIEAAIAVLKVAVAMAPRSARPAPLCMLAWLSWALGRGSVAGIFIDQALRIDPRYSMALLLDTVLGTGHLPDWAYAVPTL